MIDETYDIDIVFNKMKAQYMAWKPMNLLIVKKHLFSPFRELNWKGQWLCFVNK
jgi:hypothetical protein